MILPLVLNADSEATVDAGIPKMSRAIFDNSVDRDLHREARAGAGGADGVVLYTTTLRGVRRTFEDYERARQLVEAHCMEAGVDERDVSLHGEYLRELRELVGEEATVPRLFVKGRYVGGIDEVVEMNETGRLMLRLVRGEGSGAGWRGCGNCGGDWERKETGRGEEEGSGLETLPVAGPMG
ncbi:hypothetical protein Taro_001813 [Colocasia esculenta]|uniref:Glutaredoxin domain-containing protein n=1 Tax=Colocasia esculenta TaxID=4460 RepID=A0A843TK10_COLES|nr:hypothetical protein [Colocasia esculenta]